MNYICVISDSHSRRHLIEELLPVINKADLFVFLGDCTGDIYNFRSEIKPQIVAVSGNCDIIKAYPDEEIFEWQKPICNRKAGRSSIGQSGKYSRTTLFKAVLCVDLRRKR